MITKRYNIVKSDYFKKKLEQANSKSFEQLDFIFLCTEVIFFLRNIIVYLIYWF